MEENKNNSVPYIVYESSEARHERTAKRLIIALVASILVTLVSNLAWIWLWNQYDYVSETTTETRTFLQDGKGINIIGDTNEVKYEPESDVLKDGAE